MTGTQLGHVIRWTAWRYIKSTVSLCGLQASMWWAYLQQQGKMWETPLVLVWMLVSAVELGGIMKRPQQLRRQWGMVDDPKMILPVDVFVCWLSVETMTIASKYGLSFNVCLDVSASRVSRPLWSTVSGDWVLRDSMNRSLAVLNLLGGFLMQ